MIRVRHGLRVLAGVAALLVIIVGIPTILVLIAGWPLPRAVPAWDRVVTALRQGDIDGRTVVKAIACLVWIAWALLAWALVWEVAVNMRRVGHGQPPRSAPMVPDAVGLGMARLVALVFSVGLAIASAPRPALARPGPVAALVGPAPVVRSAEPTRTAPIGPTWRAAAGDSLWSIAETTLGSGDRFIEILELNPSIGSPRNLRAGQVLKLPAGAVIGTSHETAAPTVTTYQPERVVEVVRGDTLWQLSEDRLAGSTGADPAPLETIEYLQEVIDANPDTIESPDLIFPGERFTFPALGDPPPAATSAAPPASVAPVPTPSQRTPPTTSPMVPTTSPPSTMLPTVQQTFPPPQTVAPAAAEHDGRPWFADLAGATVLASGLWVVYRKAKQRHGARGAKFTRTPDHLRDTERQLLRAADVPLVRWANLELAHLCERLKPADIDGGPIAVEFSADHGIELLWDKPNPTAPTPWEATDGGWSWRILYDPDAHIPNKPEPAPIPGLVTVGTRNGNSLLVDLEAFGSIAITGDQERSRDLVRSIVLELSSCEEFANAYVHLISVDLGIAENDRVQHHTDTDFEVDVIVNDTQSLLASSRLDDTFKLRLGGDAAGRELTVVVIDSTTPGGPVPTPPARRGVVTLMLGETENGGATLHVSPDGSALLQPLGLSFDACGVRRSTVNVIVELNETIIEDDAMAELSLEPLSETVDDVGCSVRPHVALLVRVIGPPMIEGFEDKLRPLDASLVAFLACNGGKATVDQILDAVWSGNANDMGTFWNRVGRVRSILGSEVVPGREQGSMVVGLGEGVVTDVELLKNLLERTVVSRTSAAALVAEATDLIRGRPFDGGGFDWAHTQLFHIETCNVIESAVLSIADTAASAGDITNARDIIMSGLRALGPHESVIRAWMQIEADYGDHARVQAVYNDLIVYLREIEGPSAQPSPETKALLAELLALRDGRSPEP